MAPLEVEQGFAPLEVSCCVRVTGLLVGLVRVQVPCCVRVTGLLGLEQSFAPLEARRHFRVTGLVVGRACRHQRILLLVVLMPSFGHLRWMGVA